MTLKVRNMQIGQTFRLKRTGELYTLLGHKRDTPGGTQYVVQRSGFAKPTTLHHSCHVELLEDAK
jgi:hypothetical protein